MLRVVQHSWRQSLAALTLFSVIGTSDAVAQAEPSAADVGVVTSSEEEGFKVLVGVGVSSDAGLVGSIQEKLGDKERKEKHRDDKGNKPSETLDELRERLKQLEEENAKLREALGQQKKGKVTDEAVSGSKQPQGSTTRPTSMPPTFEKPSVSTRPSGVPGTARAVDGKKETPEGLALKLKEMQDEIAQVRKADRTEEAEKLEGLAAELRERLMKHAEARPADGHGSFGAVREKAKQWLNLAEKLRAAGQTEEAEQLEQRARQVLLELEFLGVASLKEQGEEEKRRASATLNLLKSHYVRPAQKEAGHEINQPIAQAELARSLQELREELSRLRDEVAELRRMVKEPERTPKK